MGKRKLSLVFILSIIPKYVIHYLFSPVANRNISIFATLK